MYFCLCLYLLYCFDRRTSPGIGTACLQRWPLNSSSRQNRRRRMTLGTKFYHRYMYLWTVSSIVGHPHSSCVIIYRTTFPHCFIHTVMWYVIFYRYGYDVFKIFIPFYWERTRFRTVYLNICSCVVSQIRPYKDVIKQNVFFVLIYLN